MEVEVEVEVRDWQIKAFPKRHTQNDEQTLIEITSRWPFLVGCGSKVLGRVDIWTFNLIARPECILHTDVTYNLLSVKVPVCNVHELEC